jgi:hypothetical protein
MLAFRASVATSGLLVFAPTGVVDELKKKVLVQRKRSAELGEDHD